MFKKNLFCYFALICCFFILSQTAKAQETEEDIVGYVKVETTNLYAKADDKAIVLSPLKKGELVLVLDQTTKPDWWKIFSSSGKEGWVKSSDIGLSTDDSAMYRTYAVKLDPVVRIMNQTRLTITINIGGGVHKILAGKQKTVSFKSGAFPYTIKAPGFSAGTGTKVFQAGQFYTWKFSIKTKVVKRRG